MVTLGSIATLCFEIISCRSGSISHIIRRLRDLRAAKPNTEKTSKYRFNDLFIVLPSFGSSFLQKCIVALEKKKATF